MTPSPSLSMASWHASGSAVAVGVAVGVAVAIDVGVAVAMGVSVGAGVGMTTTATQVLRASSSRLRCTRGKRRIEAEKLLTAQVEKVAPTRTRVPRVIRPQTPGIAPPLGRKHVARDPVSII